ncbi:MAG: hypothetical protein D6736_03315 [Nitrospinota bacterium]|nr:MAG: hypothetical protein D6736_03315 [Nitrospinota bacterium]
MEDRYTRLYARIEQALREKPKRDALYRAMKRGRDARAQALTTLPGGERFQQEVRATKLRCLDRQDILVAQFVEKVRERGAQVFLARDGAEAIQYILRLAQERQARVVAKSKSLTSEEIEVNHPLEAEGIQVIETDLGELIIQQVHEKPFHLVFPAVHKTAKEVAEIFHRVTQAEVPADADAIMQVVRRYLRPIFLQADIGMTGANIGIAETGTIVIETNEGNARLVSSIPDLHICIIGREKIVEKVEDALLLMLAHPLSSVGQLLTTYVTIMGGRSPLGTGGDSRESHIIILDNGRTRMREDPWFKDALNCIRCGACMNICPTYGVVGGHTFGYIYPGPIGIPWTAEIHGLEKAGDFAPLCISCGLCKEICPAEIDLPMLIAAVKHRDMTLHPPPLVNRVLMQAETFARVGSATAPLSNWFLQNSIFRRLLERIAGIDHRRNLPPFQRETLMKRFRRRRRAPLDQPVRRVVYFVDLYANYNAPDLGLAVIEHLEALGCEVVLPPQKSSGYPYVGYGDLERARQVATYNVQHLAPYARQGYDIVVTEPTAAYTLKFVYPKLLDDREEARLVADRTQEFFAYLLALEEERGVSAEQKTLPLQGRRLGFHLSCHQRPLGAGREAMTWLKRRGATVELIETGTCCGMGGTFGLKSGLLGYQLSQAVGEPLFQAFRDAGVEAIVTESSVCRIHLAEGTQLPVYHPLQLLSS